ncbi:hypothetical protein DFH27DRAFT_616329 [Peziza echinospora]|nr:hypothetical protein DFH27DRAFT_616329 [Peziza echinospora]
MSMSNGIGGATTKAPTNGPASGSGNNELNAEALLNITLGLLKQDGRADNPWIQNMISTQLKCANMTMSSPTNSSQSSPPESTASQKNGTPADNQQSNDARKRRGKRAFVPFDRLGSRRGVLLAARMGAQGDRQECMNRAAALKTAMLNHTNGINLDKRYEGNDYDRNKYAKQSRRLTKAVKGRTFTDNLKRKKLDSQNKKEIVELGVDAKNDSSSSQPLRPQANPSNLQEAAPARDEGQYRAMIQRITALYSDRTFNNHDHWTQGIATNDITHKQTAIPVTPSLIVAVPNTQPPPVIVTNTPPHTVEVRGTQQHVLIERIPDIQTLNMSASFYQINQLMQANKIVIPSTAINIMHPSIPNMGPPIGPCIATQTYISSTIPSANTAAHNPDCQPLQTNMLHPITVSSVMPPTNPKNLSQNLQESQFKLNDIEDSQIKSNEMQQEAEEDEEYFQLMDTLIAETETRGKKKGKAAVKPRVTKAKAPIAKKPRKTKKQLAEEALLVAGFTDKSVGQWLALTPSQVVKETLHLSDETIRGLSKEKPLVAKGTSQ